MSEPKQHHHIAEMHQKRFCDRNGDVYFLRKGDQSRTIRKTKPRKIFKQRHQYSFINRDGSKDSTLEKSFSYIEGEANRILEYALPKVRSGRRPNLPSQDKELWDHYFHHQWQRVPDLDDEVYPLEEFLEDIPRAIASVEADFGRQLSEEEKSWFEDPKNRKDFRHNARVLALGKPGERIMDLLENSGLCFGISPSNFSFVLGSVPVVPIQFPAFRHVMGSVNGIWLPIADDVVVSPAGTSGLECVVRLNENQTRRLNEQISLQSTMIAGSSEALIRSIADFAWRST